MANATNTHFSRAKSMQEGVHDWQSETGQTDATMICTAIDALVESNLAIAYEQRTATMQQFLAAQMKVVRQMLEGGEEAAALHPFLDKLERETAERLDLA